MDDKQVDKIVEALQGSDDLWSSLGIPLGSALFGALLTLGLQWLADNRRSRDDARGAKFAAARSAAVVAARFGVVPGQMYFELLKQWDLLVAPVQAELSALDRSGNVAGWWTRQMSKLVFVPEGPDVTFTDAQNVIRGTHAQVIQDRLLTWAEGKAKPAEFASEHDAAYAEKVGLNALKK